MEQLTGQALALADRGLAVALGWAGSPAAWSQVALLLLAYLAARLLAARLSPALTRLLTPPEGRDGPLSRARRFALLFLPLLLPLLAYGLTALGESVTRSLFGSGEVIAFGKRVFLFLAARALVREVLADRFLLLLGRYVLLPLAALHALGLLDDLTLRLDETVVALGNIRFSLLTLVRGAIAGSLLFWLGSWSNRQSADYIKRQDDLRPATRELAAKAAEVAIFGAAFLLLMSILGIDLTAVAVLGGALGVGIGLGLQQIAANIVSGVILLIEGETTVGDYVRLDGGEEGTIVKMTARACVLQTFDGRMIVVPNDHFITTRVTNFSTHRSPNRYAASFSVIYDTDLNRVPEVVARAVAALPFVLKAPSPPEVALKVFAPGGVEFSVEFWVPGVDGGPNSYMSPVMFAIWNALKEAGIEMPHPPRPAPAPAPAPAAQPPRA